MNVQIPPGRATSWWAGPIEAFISTPPADIIDRIANRLFETYTTNRARQLKSWSAKTKILHQTLAQIPPHWRLILGYPLLRLNRRADAILISPAALFVIDIKLATKHFPTEDRRKIEDFALDLSDFHAASQHAVIVPILLATEAPPQHPTWPLFWHHVAPVFCAAPSQLAGLITSIASRLPSQNINVVNWDSAPYRPVPTIIEAATQLYASHTVADIATARADTKNLAQTTKSILDAITHARATNTHSILFVTGIPGGGKTLTGLNTVFGAPTGAAFLTGNLPLVHVLREAFARDAGAKGFSLRQARQKAESAIQPLTGFIRDNLRTASKPHEQIIVFDEAQRAWDQTFGAKKFSLPDSEAGLVLDIMARHPNFAVIVALVGNGQEINSGEAGLAEWGLSLRRRPNWQVRAGAEALSAPEPRQRLFDARPATLTLDPSLHLSIPIRQIRSRSGAAWVDLLVRGEIAQAREVAGSRIPFYVTRSLPHMRCALKTLARGQRSAGLVCSSAAKRLIADGISPGFDHLDNEAVAAWFLNRWPDVRACNALEIPATPFAIQGLELDYIGLCWGNDFIWAGAWQARKFHGTAWQTAKTPDVAEFRRNSYRVLLTRARYETIIWVPEGDPDDRTREPHLFTQTAELLLAAGAQPLPSHLTTPTIPEPLPTLFTDPSFPCQTSHN